MSGIPTALGAVFAFVIGACVGSFANVIAYRLPRERSIVTPGSTCENCARRIPLWANIPILAYVALRGRCVMCGAPIPLRYLLTEFALALCAFYLYLAFPLPDAIARLVLCAALLTVSLTDLDFRTIPDEISLPGIAIGIAAATFAMPEVGWRSSLIGVAAGGVFLFAVGELYRLLRGLEGMGMGDVKLMAMIGAFLGWPGVLFTLLAGSLLGSAGGTLMGLAQRRAAAQAVSASGEGYTAEVAEQPPLLQTPIPFGPFISLAAACYALFQPQLAGWYLGH